MGAERRKEEIIFFINLFFASWVGFPLFPEILYFITIILQRIRIIVGDAGFEPGTYTTNEPPHLPLFYPDFASCTGFCMLSHLSVLLGGARTGRSTQCCPGAT